MCETEKLIYLVKERPFLYDMSDPEYKNRTKRQETWKEIAAEMGSGNGDIWSAKWKGLKDNYAKYKKSSEPDEHYKKYKNWPWVDQVRFLDDCNFISGRRTRYTPSNNVADDANTEDLNDVELEVTINRSTRKRRTVETPEEDQENRSQKRRYNHITLDETDEFFHSYGQAFKKLPRRMQILLKVEIATLFARFELQADGVSNEAIESFPRVVPFPSVKLEHEMLFASLDD